MTLAPSQARLAEAVLRFAEDFPVGLRPAIVSTIVKADTTLEGIVRAYLRARLAKAAPALVRELKQSDLIERLAHPDSATFAEDDTPEQIWAKKLVYSLRTQGISLPQFTPNEMQAIGIWGTETAKLGDGPGGFPQSVWGKIESLTGPGFIGLKLMAPLGQALGLDLFNTPNSYTLHTKPFVKSIGDIELPQPITKAQLHADVDAIVAKALGPDGITEELISQTIAALDPVAHAGFTTALQQVGVEAPTSLRYTLVNAAARAWLGSHTNALYKSVDEATKKQVGKALAAGLGKGERVEQLGDRILKLVSSYPVWKARSVAQTESMNSFNRAVEESVGAVGGKQVQWLGGQKGACPLCSSFHGKVKTIGGTFHSEYGESSGPPGHTNCRCITTIYISEDEEGLGLNYDDIAALQQAEIAQAKALVPEPVAAKVRAAKPAGTSVNVYDTPSGDPYHTWAGVQGWLQKHGGDYLGLVGKPLAEAYPVYDAMHGLVQQTFKLHASKNNPAVLNEWATALSALTKLDVKFFAHLVGKLSAQYGELDFDVLLLKMADDLGWKKGTLDSSDVVVPGNGPAQDAFDWDFATTDEVGAYILQGAPWDFADKAGLGALAKLAKKYDGDWLKFTKAELEAWDKTFDGLANHSLPGLGFNGKIGTQSTLELAEFLASKLTPSKLDPPVPGNLPSAPSPLPYKTMTNAQLADEILTGAFMSKPNKEHLGKAAKAALEGDLDGMQNAFADMNDAGFKKVQGLGLPKLTADAPGWFKTKLKVLELPEGTPAGGWAEMSDLELGKMLQGKLGIDLGAHTENLGKLAKQAGSEEWPEEWINFPQNKLYGATGLYEVLDKFAADHGWATGGDSNAVLKNMLTSPSRKPKSPDLEAPPIPNLDSMGPVATFEHAFGADVLDNPGITAGTAIAFGKAAKAYAKSGDYTDLYPLIDGTIPNAEFAILKQEMTKQGHTSIADLIKTKFTGLDTAPPKAPEVPPEVVPFAAPPTTGYLGAQKPLPFDASKAPKTNAAGMGGAHTKYKLTDPDGASWMFKPAGSKPYQASAEMVVQDFAGRVGLTTPEVYVTTVGGEYGSLQKLLSFEKEGWSPGMAKTLSRTQLVELQKHQVVDWLFSQHDSNKGAPLFLKDGRVVMIDKGQAFKFFGKDKLDPTYNPNAGFESLMVPNDLWASVAKGDIQLSYADVQPFIQRVQSIPDAEFLRYLSPYIDDALKAGVLPFGDRAKFEQAAIARKNGLGKDFEAFYKKQSAVMDRPLVKATTVEAPDIPEPKMRPKPVASQSIQNAVDEPFMHRIHANANHGQSLLFDSDVFESLDLRIRPIVDEAGHTYVRVEGKIRNGAPSEDLERKLRQLAEEQGVSTSGLNGAKAQAPQDPLYTPMVALVKHINTHGKPGADGIINQQKVIDAFNAWNEMMLKGGDIAQHYAAAYGPVMNSLFDTFGIKGDASLTSEIFVQKVKEKVAGTAKQTGASPVYQGPMIEQKPYVPKSEVKAKPAETNEGPKITSFSKEQGALRFSKRGEPMVYKRLEKTTALEGYNIELPDGTKIFYNPQSAGVLSSKGTIHITRPAKGSAVTEADIEQTVKSLEKLGLPATMASAAQIEELYLLQHFRARKLTAPAPDPSRDRLEQLNEEFKRQTKIDLRASPFYNPQPNYDTSVTQTGETLRAGTAYWQRADFTETQYSRIKKDYGLFHDTKMGAQALFDAVIEDAGGWMMPTERRHQEAIGTGTGMSENADRDSGGASYIFTRMYKRGEAGQAYGTRLWFDVAPAMRTTSVHYGRDLYGRISDFESSHIGDPAQWGLNLGSGNERLIKNGFNALEHLRGVSFGSQAEATRFLTLMKKKFGATNPYTQQPWEDLVFVGKPTNE